MCIRDRIKTARKIYDHLDLNWTDEHARLAQEFCDNHKKNKYGKHVYSLADYGLTEDQVRAEFTDYLEQFDSYLDYN